MATKRHKSGKEGFPGGETLVGKSGAGRSKARDESLNVPSVAGAPAVAMSYGGQDGGEGGFGCACGTDGSGSSG